MDPVIVLLIVAIVAVHLIDDIMVGMIYALGVIGLILISPILITIFLLHLLLSGLRKLMNLVRSPL